MSSAGAAGRASAASGFSAAPPTPRYVHLVVLSFDQTFSPAVRFARLDGVARPLSAFATLPFWLAPMCGHVGLTSFSSSSSVQLKGSNVCFSNHYGKHLKKIKKLLLCRRMFLGTDFSDRLTPP